MIRPSQIEILYLWTSFFLEDKNAVDYKSRSIFSQSYLKLKVFFLFLFTITTVAHSNFGEVNVKFFTLCRLVFQHSCWWANFISFYVPLYKNFLVIFRAMYDDFVFKRFPLAKVIFLRAPMPKWLFMPTEACGNLLFKTYHALFVSKMFLLQVLWRSNLLRVLFSYFRIKEPASWISPLTGTFSGP